MRSLVVLLLAFSSNAFAQGLVPGPGEPGHDAALESLAGDYDRQIHGIMNVELGWGLEAFVDDAEDRARIERFIASGERDFRAATGRHIYESVTVFGEYGDLGMFGGVQTAGDAFRYAVLRDEGAPAADVDAARNDLLRAMDGLHWYMAVTGQPGIIARGIRRRLPADGDPALPVPAPDTVPMRDASGNPLPAEKEPTWRDDQSGELPFLIWLDDTSKDQFDGYVYALGAVWDVVAEDSTIPSSYKDRLVDDARALAQRLMTPTEVSPGNVTPLVLMDADGRPTTFHDLSAEEVASGVVMRRPLNGFNALMSLGAMRTLFHITGDTDVGQFYRALIDEKGYLDSAEDTITLVYFGEMTNYSNVNMAFVAIYGVLRYETDMAIALQTRGILESRLYGPGQNRQAQGLGQALFDYMFAGFRLGGSTGDGATAIRQGTQNLAEFPMPPYWNPRVENCDDAEVRRGRCTAIDGTTILELAERPGRGGSVVAVDPLPKRLRPPDNFEWRSDPHSVNGGGGGRLNPGGGFHGAYWLGRYLRATSNGLDNISPLARPLPPARPRPDAGTPGADAGVDAALPDGGTVPDAGSGGGGGCSVGATRSAGVYMLVLIALVRRSRAYGR